MTSGVPLAWLQLKREKLRLAVAVAGVTFAVILVFMQVGFRQALFTSATRFHAAIDGEIVLVSPTFDILVQPKSFSRRRLYQARALPDVEAVVPIYLGLGLWKNPDTGKSRSMFVIGVDPSNNAVGLFGVGSQLDRIRSPDVVLFDRLARPEFGAVPAAVAAGDTVSSEINNRHVSVGGLFDFGTSFGIDGSVLTSEVNFLRIFPERQKGLIDIGVIRIRPGADIETTRAQLAASMDRDVRVLTVEQYVAQEQRYWADATPIGFVFNFGAIMGFVVGAIIVYQILYTDVADHLAQYATLKAIGYSDAYLFKVVLSEAIILAVLGFLPGMAISFVLYRLAAEVTLLPMVITPPILALVLGQTLVMCAISGAVAVRKVRSADPAEIF